MKAYQKETELSASEYEDVLNELYEPVTICGMDYEQGTALKELDPVAFRCGKADYESDLDSDNPTWICGECDTEFDSEEEAEECCNTEEG